MKIGSFLLGITLLALLVACNKKKDSPSGPPPAALVAISSISPEIGTYNTVVTITGNNFSTSATANIVKFNGVQAAVLTATVTSLTVKVPKGAGDGKVTVTVKGKTAEGPVFSYRYTVTVTTFAGGAEGHTDGQGIHAQFWLPWGLAIDTLDNLYVTDYSNHCIRKITPQADVTTFAGKPGGAGIGYANGLRSDALFGYLAGMCVDTSANALYVVDAWPGSTKRIRRIDLSGQGLVTTFAGGGTDTDETVSNPLNIKFGYIDMCVASNDKMDKWLYVVEDGNRVKRIGPSGASTLAGKKGTPGYLDGQGSNALFAGSLGMAKAIDDNIFLTDAGNYRIRKVSFAGATSTFAGNGIASRTDAASRLNASFSMTRGDAITVDAKGNTYVMEDGHLRMISVKGQVVTLTMGGFGYMDGSGAKAQFSDVHGMVCDKQGNIFVADYSNHRIRKIVVEQ